METRIKITESGSRNSLTGDSLISDMVEIGHFYFIDLFGAFRFSLPISKEDEINYASISLYLCSVEGNNKKVKMIFDISKETDALPLEFGLDRVYSLENIVYDTELKIDEWNTFEITQLIKKAIDQDSWKKGNHVLLRVRINNEGIFRFGTDASGPIISVECNETRNSIMEKVSIEEKILIPPLDPIKEFIRLNNLELHLEDLSFDFNRQPEPYGVGSDEPVSISCSERLEFDEAYYLFDLVGKTLPMKVGEDKFNVIVSECTLNFDLNFIHANFSLIVI